MQGDFRMLIGKHRGKLVSELRTPYLLWVLAQDWIRDGYRNTARAVYAELRRRFQDPDRIEAELMGGVPYAASDLI
jgi:hypothetical protein